MFKALLVIYVVAIGEGGDFTNSGSLSSTLFETMEQCEAAIVHMKTVTDKWHYGEDKSKIVPLKKTIECFEIPPGPTPAAAIPVVQPADEVEITPVSPPDPRIHKRWHDQ